MDYYIEGLLNRLSPSGKWKTWKCLYLAISPRRFDRDENPLIDNINVTRYSMG